MLIHYSNARCGAGKTYWACQRMARTPGRYVLAVDRKAVAQERETTIRAYAYEAGMTGIEVAHVYSGEDAGSAQESVARRVEATGEAYGDHPHVIVICTHAGMRQADFAHYDGWEIIIDEAPSVLETRCGATGALLSWLEASYSLNPCEEGSTIEYIGAFSTGEVARSPGGDWVNFHRMVTAGGAKVNITSWREADTWIAWSVWDARRLSPFSRISILADSFLATECYRHLSRDPTIEFRAIDEIAASDNRVWQQRDVVIRYFTDDHVSGSSRFSKETWAPELRKVGRWLAENTPDGSKHLWTCNDAIASLLRSCKIPGTKVQPMQAGSNSYTDMQVASMIYTAKPSPVESKLYALWEISSDDLIAARERYSLHQFFLRTAIRLPQDTRSLEFRVYDREQARDLADYLWESYGLTAELLYTDVGLSPVETVRKSKTKPPATIEERREWERTRKAAQRAKLKVKRKLARGAA